MGGYQLMIADEVFRGRFRKSFEKPEPLVPGEPSRITRSTCTPTTTASSRATGSWSRSRAPGSRSSTGTRRRSSPNIFLAKASDYRTATQRVFRSAAHPSHIVLPVKK